jgi:hypothetical protein
MDQSAKRRVSGARGRSRALVELILAWFATEYLLEVEHAYTEASETVDRDV